MNKVWRRRLHRGARGLGWVAGVLVILFAVLTALAQLLLPLLARHPEWVAAQLSQRLQRPVAIASMAGRWTPSGPEFLLHQVRIGAAAGTDGAALELPESRLKLDLGGWLLPSRHLFNVYMRGLQLDLLHDASGWRVSGLGTAAGANQPALSLRHLSVDLWLDDLRVVVTDATLGKRYTLLSRQLRISSQGDRIRFGGSLRREGVAEASVRFPQQMMRIDRQTGRDLDAQIRDQLSAVVRAAAPLADAVLFSDYRGGVVSREVVETSMDVCRAQGTIATADSQGDLFKFRRLNVVKCNQQEAEAALADKLDGEASFERAAATLLERLGARAVVITRGGDGISMLDARRGYAHIPAANRTEVFDVTGAGDTVIAVLTMALAAGASEYQATCLANIAAGLVVRRLGNATTTVEELTNAIQPTNERGGT